MIDENIRVISTRTGYLLEVSGEEICEIKDSRHAQKLEEVLGLGLSYYERESVWEEEQEEEADKDDEIESLKEDIKALEEEKSELEKEKEELQLKLDAYYEIYGNLPL